MNKIFIGNIKGEKGDTGTGLTVKDFYGTVDELNASVPNPSVGDAYGIGEEAPYDIYIYSETNGWVNSGAFQPDINEQTPNYAEATTLETLTSGEKISLAFGKIKKAITELIAHKSDTTGHITSDERIAWNDKASNGHGLGDMAETKEDTSFIDTMQYGCGFYQIGTDADTPKSNSEWMSLLQVVRNNTVDNETGVQMAFYDFDRPRVEMWMRTILRGTAGEWVEMLHSGNIDDYRHKIVTGAYTGDGTTPRKISLGFTPDIVLVFGKSGMVSFLTQQNGYRGCGGMAFKGFPCKVGDTATIEIVDGGFNVAYVSPNGDATVNVPMSNEKNTQYYYMAIRQPIH